VAITGRSAGEAVVETLLAWGVRHVFICPGSTEAAFLDASLDHPDLEVILAPHEAIAVSAADGYARATGDPAVAYLHSHLGLANGLGHLDAARLARSPVVVLNGLKPAAIQAHEGFTSIPSTGRLAEPFVKWQWQSLTAAGQGHLRRRRRRGRARLRGVAAARLCDAKEIGPAIDRARARGGPSLIEVMTDPSDFGP
jgi:thiamine pyrophosphate-dependent acetolactate synthase large subunit-like protein